MTQPQTSEIIQIQEQAILRWKSGDESLIQNDFYRLVEENHHFNYSLWHAEDRARREDKGFEFVYRAKREIDGFNQQRNNRMEAMDEWLYHHLQPSRDPQCPVHSESPGMMIDRLSILALKSYHMALQTQRRDVSQAHIDQCQQKLAVIKQQQAQLGQCLQQLLLELEQKTRTFRVYHQFKMYNDPQLNPELYAK